MNVEVKFTCSHCQQKIQCDSTMVDHEVDCPVCSQRLTVPSPQPETLANEKTCSLCQKLVNEKEKTCPHCGYDFKASEALNFQSELKKEMATTGFVVNIILLTGVFFFFINESPELWKKYPKTIVLLTLALAVLLYIGRHELLKVGKGGGGGGSCGSGCGGE